MRPLSCKFAAGHSCQVAGTHLLMVLAECLQAEARPSAGNRPGPPLIAMIGRRGAHIARSVAGAAGAALRGCKQGWQAGLRSGSRVQKARPVHAADQANHLERSMDATSAGQRTSLEGSSRRLVASQSTCGALAAGMWLSFMERHVTRDQPPLLPMLSTRNCCTALHTCCAVAPQRRNHSKPKCSSQNCCRVARVRPSAAALSFTAGTSLAAPTMALPPSIELN